MRLIMAVVASAALSLGAGSSPSGKGVIDIQYIPCLSDIARGNVFFEARNVTTRQIAISRKLPTQWSGSVALVSVKLPKGAYRVYVSDGPCADNFFLYVLPNHTRHITAFASKGVRFFEQYTSLAGAMPLKGALMSVIYGDESAASAQNGVEIPVDIQDGAYYVESIPNGHVFLRIRDVARTRYIDIDVGIISNSSPRRRNVEFNIQPQEIAKQVRLSHRW